MVRFDFVEKMPQGLNAACLLVTTARLKPRPFKASARFKNGAVFETITIFEGHCKLLEH